MNSNKEKSFVSAIFYLHNNEETVIPFLTVLVKVLNDHFLNFEIVCVNDCSTDNGVSKVREFASHTEHVMLNIINMSMYQGKELAMNAGVDLAIGDFVFEFDSVTMDYPHELIMNVYHHSLEGFDIVSACPNNEQNSSRLFYRVFNNSTHRCLKLRTERFRVLSRRAINRAQSMNKTIPYRKAVYSNCGLKMDAILYQQTERTPALSGKQEKKYRKTLAVEALVLFTDIAYRLSLVLALLMVLFSAFSGGYALIMYCLKNDVIAGWTTTMLFLSVTFSGVFLIQAIIIKYLSVLIHLVFNKQKYLVESIEKITN